MATIHEPSSDGRAAARDIKNGWYGWYEKAAMEKIETLPRRQQASCKLIYIAVCSMSAKQKNAPIIECYKFDIARFASVDEKTVQRYLPELEKLGIVGVSPQDRLSDGRYSKMKIWLTANNPAVGHLEESSEKVRRKLDAELPCISNKEIKEETNKEEAKASSASGGQEPLENEKNLVRPNPESKEISAMLEAIKLAAAVTEFKESRDQQRVWARNFLFLLKGTQDRKPIPPAEVKRRLREITLDEFKSKNRSSIRFLYREVKGWVQQPGETISTRVR